MKFLITLILAFVTGSAFATMPVIDYTEVVKTTQMISQMQKEYTTLKDQYDTVKKQYDTMNHQYSVMQDQYNSITGNYGWGNLKNSLNDLKKDREWAASDWQSALKGLSGGNAARYQELVAQYQSSNKLSVVESDTFQAGADPVLAESYDNQVKTNQASSAQASYEFSDINRHFEDLHELTAGIENAQKNHDLKSAMDLNSRISAEIGFIQVEMLRMITVLNQQVAQMQAAQINRQTQIAQFNSAGESP